MLPRWTGARIRQLGGIALPVAVATVLGVLYVRMLVVLMSLLSDNERELGYLVTSARVLELSGGLPFLVVAVVLPVLSVAARDDHERLVYMTSRIAQVMALGGVLIALVIWTLARPILLVLGGDEYGPAAPVLQIQCFAAITIFITAGWQPALFGMGRVKWLAAAMALGLVAVIVSGLLLIPPFDATGAAIAAVIGDVVLCAAVYTALRRSGPGAWLGGTAAVARILAASLAAVAVGLIPGIPDGVRAVLVVSVFSAAALVLRAVPSEITDAARAAVKR